MSRINLHNYEAYLLDAAENRLSDAERKELEAFLLAHPELEAAWSDELPYLTPGTDTFAGASLLLKDEPDEEEVLLLAYIEGLLTVTENKKVEARLKQDAEFAGKWKALKSVRLVADEQYLASRQNLFVDRPTAEEEMALEIVEGLMSPAAMTVNEELVRSFERTRLVADESVVFEQKDSLYRNAKVISLGSAWVRMAAGIALIAMITVLLWPTENGQMKIAQQEQVSSPVEPVAENQVNEKEQQLILPEPVKQIASVPVTSSQKPVRISVPSPQKKFPEKKSQSDSITISLPANNQAELLLADVSQENTVKQDTLTRLITAFELLPVEKEELADAGEREGLIEKAAGVFANLRKLGVRGVEAEKTSGTVVLTLHDLRVEKKRGGM